MYGLRAKAITYSSKKSQAFVQVFKAERIA